MRAGRYSGWFHRIPVRGRQAGSAFYRSAGAVLHRWLPVKLSNGFSRVCISTPPHHKEIIA